MSFVKPFGLASGMFVLHVFYVFLSCCLHRDHFTWTFTSTSRSTCTYTSRSTRLLYLGSSHSLSPRKQTRFVTAERPTRLSYRTTYKQLMVGTMVCFSSMCSIGVSFNSFARFAHPTDASSSIIYRHTSSCENFRKSAGYSNLFVDSTRSISPTRKRLPTAATIMAITTGTLSLSISFL